MAYSVAKAVIRLAALKTRADQARLVDPDSAVVLHLIGELAEIIAEVLTSAKSVR